MDGDQESQKFDHKCLLFKEEYVASQGISKETKPKMPWESNRPD